jgi:hypothetical protein
VTHPVALICYNRPGHLARVIMALEAIKPDPLYIFSDGPKDEIDEERIAQVRLVLQGVQWTEPIVISRFRNIGLAASIISAVDRVLRDHETIVVLEDDCVPGPYFYDYMAACLERYKDHDRIMAISGYAYRLPPETFIDYKHDVFCFPRIETWGWATWRGAWQHYIRDECLAAKFEEAQRLGIDLEAGGKDVPNIIRNKIKRGVDSWSPGWLLGTAMVGGLTVYPVKSHIEYIGDDGSGTNMPDSGRWGTDTADRHTIRLPDGPTICPAAYMAMRGIFDGL